MAIRRSSALIAAAVLLSTLTACQTLGPSRGAVQKAATQAVVPGLHFVDVNSDVARQLALASGDGRDTFARDLSGAQPVGTTVGIGDTVEVTIWEASPPATIRASGRSSKMPI